MSWIYEVHECVQPTETSGFGQGSIWQCECGQMWEWIWVGFRTGSLTGFAWSRFDKRFWVEEEQRPMTSAEQAKIRAADWSKFQASLPVKQSWWRRAIALIKGEKE